MNIISGKPSTGAATEAGYVLSAYEAQTIEGFRLDDSSVARFTFAKAGDSYVQAEKGLKGTTGVIGCRVYREKVALPVPIIKEVHHHHDHYHDYWRTYRGPWWFERFENEKLYLSNHTDTTCVYNSSLGQSDSASRSMSERVLYACSTKAVQSSVTELETNPFELGTAFGEKTESVVNKVGFEVDTIIGELLLYYTTRAGLEALGIDLTKTKKVAFPVAFGSGEYCSPPRSWQG